MKKENDNCCDYCPKDLTDEVGFVKIDSKTDKKVILCIKCKDLV